MGGNVAVVLAAGASTRMGRGIEKVLLPIAGRPLLAWTLDAFERSPHVDAILLVVAEGAVERYRQLILPRWHLRKLAGVIAGGATRHGSERAALQHLAPAIERGAVDLLLVHDGARPLVSGRLIGDLVVAARAAGAAIPAVPADEETEIVAVAPAGTIERALPSGSVWFAQTPQVFRAALLLECARAGEAAGFDGTDTAACLERAGQPVRLIPGDPHNVKVTVPEDLIRAELLLRRRAATDEAAE